MENKLGKRWADVTLVYYEPFIDPRKVFAYSNRG